MATPTQAAEARRAEIALPEPYDYAHRYHTHGGGTVIRFGTAGREINGGAPIEAIPVYLADQLTPLLAELSRLTSDAEQMHRENAELEVVNARLVTEIERLTAVLAAREEQCHGLAEAAMNNGQQLLLFERALERIVELKYSEAGEPFDDAIDIAEKALAARPTPADSGEG